jgi:hypothetical protein
MVKYFSWDSNWSLNAALVSKRAMLEMKVSRCHNSFIAGTFLIPNDMLQYPSSKGPKTLAEIGLSHWREQVSFQ